MNRQVGLTILAVVLFLVALVLHLIGGSAGKPDVILSLVIGGLASFAAAHLP